MDDPVTRCTQLGPNFSTLAKAPLNWSVADGQIKNRIALTGRFINFNETVKQKCFVPNVMYRISSYRLKYILIQSNCKIIWSSASLKKINQCLRFFCREIIFKERKPLKPSLIVGRPKLSETCQRCFWIIWGLKPS